VREPAAGKARRARRLSTERRSTRNGSGLAAGSKEGVSSGASSREGPHAAGIDGHCESTLEADTPVVASRSGRKEADAAAEADSPR